MQKKKGNLVLGLCLAMVLLNSVCISGLTGSIGNAKMILYPEVNGWFTKTIDKTILTKNVNDIPIDIKLEIDEDGKEFLELIDETYTLQPGEEQKARFQVKIKKEGTYTGKIYVFFSSDEAEGPGVVLSSSITVIAKKDQDDIYQEYEEEEEDSTPITGEITEGEEEDEREGGIGGILFFTFSSIVLIGALIFLVFLNKKRDTKKGGQINENKKK